MEVSKDGGTTWYNYSGSEGGDEETLTCDPGDTLTVRIKIWNTGDANAVNIIGNGEITNSSYIESISDVDPDNDGNSRAYTEIFFDEFHNGAISQVDLGGTESAGYESMTIVFNLSDDFPEGQTILLGTAMVDAMEIAGAEERGGDENIDQSTSFFKKLLLQKAYAQIGGGRYSRVRIAVNSELPATGADLIK